MHEDKKKKSEPNYLLIAIIVVGLFVWAFFSFTGDHKKKEPNYPLYAEAYSKKYILENLYPKADFPTQKYNITNTGRNYVVSGKFSNEGEMMHTFEVGGEFRAANTDEYYISYVSIDNNVVFGIKR